MAQGSYRTEYPLPSGTIPDGWGVNIHFTGDHPQEVAKIARAGFTWIRMDFSWSGIEKERGGYDFSAYDQLMDSLDRNHLRALFILDYGNSLYEPGAPKSDEARQAFCRFVEASIRHFRHRGILWEMWNEPNGNFWKPKTDVRQYIALAKAVGETIRSTASDEWYIGPATAGFDWNFLKPCFDAGLLAYWDAVTIHPYRQKPPESVIGGWNRLRDMIAASEPPGRKVAMFSGEWGYTTAWKGIDDKVQAAYAVRQYLVNLASGVPLSIWYDWKDDGPDATNGEDRFGITHQDTSPKAGYDEVMDLATKLRGYKVESFDIDNGQAHMRLRSSEKTTDLIWNTEAVDSMPTIGGGVQIKKQWSFADQRPGALPQGSYRKLTWRCDRGSGTPSPT